MAEEKVIISCVCSHGMGSCYAMKWTAEAVLKKNGINDFDVMVSDMATCKGDDSKIIITDVVHGATLGSVPGKKVVVLKSMLDKDAMEKLLMPAVSEMYPSAK